MKFVVCPHACCCPPSPLFPACSFCLQAPSEIAGKAPHTPQLDLAHRSHWLRTQLKDGVKCSSCTHGHMVKRTARTTIRRNAEGNGDKKEKAKRDVKSMKTDKKREKKKEQPEQAPTVIYHFALLGRHHKIIEKEEFLCFQELRHQMLRLEMGYGQPALAQENRESSVNSTNPEEIEKRSAFEAFLFCSF